MRTIGKALFLDLDGTIITTKSGGTFPKNKEDWKFADGILKRIGEYVDDGYYILIVTNQGGIEAGHITMNDFRQKIRLISDRILVETGCPFSKFSFRYSISNNSDDFYRKPNPGMAYDLALAHVLDLSQSIMVGDASGKIRRIETVYKDTSSPSGWSYRGGNYVADVDVKNIHEDELGLMGTLYFYDHADSDLKFAKVCGMRYIDVEDFISGKYPVETLEEKRNSQIKWQKLKKETIP